MDKNIVPWIERQNQFCNIVCRKTKLIAFCNEVHFRCWQQQLKSGVSAAVPCVFRLPAAFRGCGFRFAWHWASVAWLVLFVHNHGTVIACLYLKSARLLPHSILACWTVMAVNLAVLLVNKGALMGDTMRLTNYCIPVILSSALLVRNGWLLCSVTKRLG